MAPMKRNNANKTGGVRHQDFMTSRRKAGGGKETMNAENITLSLVKKERKDMARS